MSTQIVDNFQLNVGKPIDSRMVTSGTASRNALQFKYEGLRVYDLINKAPYVYIDGAWQQESSSGGSGSGGGGGGSVPAGTTNRILKYATATTIGDSAIVDKGTFTSPNIGVGKNPTVNIALDVNGKINATTLNVSTTVTATNFVGELNGSYISVKSLTVDKITAGSNNQILKTTGTGTNATVSWVNDNNTTIDISNETANTATHYLLFSSSISGSSTLKTNNGTTRLIGVKPSTSQILASSEITTNNASAPGYAFSGTTNAGLYGSTTEIGLSFNGIALLKLDTSKLSILDTSGTTVLSSTTGGINFGGGAFIKSQTTSTATSTDYSWQGDLSTGIYRPAAGQIGFSTAGTKKLTLSAAENKFFGGLTIAGNTSIDGGSLSIDGTGAYLGVNGLASVRDLSVIRNIQFKPDPSFNTLPQPAIGKVLTSDANGYATWQEPQSVPYGTIIMWLSTTIPDGWKICGSYNTSPITVNSYFDLYVYIESALSYVKVPVLVDKVIMGGTSVADGGTISPKEALTSGAKTTRNSNGSYTYTKTTTYTGNSALNFQYKGAVYTGEAEMSTGSPSKYDNVLQGDPANGGMLFTNTGITKYQQLIFIVKVNPNAQANEDGHWKLVAEGQQDQNVVIGFFG